MNKRLLVLAAMMSVCSINVIGASVDVGTETISVGTQSAGQPFDGTTISRNQIMLNENFPDESNERTIITSGSLDVSNQQSGMRFDRSGLVISDRAAATSMAPDPDTNPDPSIVKIYSTQVNTTGITVSDGQPNGLMLTYDGEAGIHAGNMQMHDVAAGEADTDAVNVSQLRDATSRINNVMANVDRKINKAGAATAALSGLHYLDYNPNDKWSFATSVGHYKNATAGAIGTSYQPNENTMVHLGVALGSESTFNLGASFKLGYQDPSLKMSRFEMAQQIKDLQADNADLRAELQEIKLALQKIR
ncbi:YadA-like family protein [Veillonella sp.]|uniref:YadA-like family protein n=1 Tax=Veillonella sp. TaxID=1926307 RepID=UPI001E0BD67E|nr:YadA-like family protein [Veillonella sp.]MBS6648937.1 YadA-like family protein [Veillonella sp.]MDU7875557.1 YadA-like family protein [Veillonella sp.]MDU7936012.1 YadA-like family protein [Veillonella sp.]